MALYYLDTSALVKLYVREPGTDFMIRLAGRAANHRLVLLSLAQVELRSAIRQRQRAGDLDRQVADAVIGSFERHLEIRFVRQALNDSVLEAASELIDRHTLRAYDAVQLAGCLALRAASGTEKPTFVCSDNQLRGAAKSEGLTDMDPSEHV